jgi:hypothetical protein
LIAHAPRLSSTALEKAFPFPGSVLGPRLALIKQSRLLREVDILLFFLVRRQPADDLVSWGGVTDGYLRSGFSIPVSFVATACPTPVFHRGCLAIANVSPADPKLAALAQL